MQYLEENNVGIDSAYFLTPVITPGQSNKIVFHVKNFGRSDVENIKVNYQINGQEYPSSPLSIKSNKEVVDTITVSSSKVGWNELTIKLNDYPIQFDDQYHLSFLVKEEIKVLVVYSKLLSEELMNYIKAIPYFKVSTQELSKLDYGKFKEFQLIILANLPQVSSGLGTELRKGLEEGVNLVVFPAPDLGNMSYKELNTAISFPTIISFDRNQREASRINTEADLFQDVFQIQMQILNCRLRKDIILFTE